MAAYAALVSLMNNIEQIQRHTRLPIHFDQKQIEALLEKVYFLIGFLESYNYHAAGKEMEDLESRITDAAYAAEDIIETHVVDSIHAQSRSSKEENEINANVNTTQAEKNLTLSCLFGIKKVLKDMGYIKEEAMKMKDQSELNDMQPRGPITTTASSSFIPVGKITMVGFDDKLLELMERLTGHESRREIISVIGMGGIGKTTLAKTAYDSRYIENYFDFRAWVSISQEYDFKSIVLGLLPKFVSTHMSDTELAQILHKRLCGRRYLVVLDDMWSVDAWNKVKMFLPDDTNGSRIIVTTRVSSVTSHLDTCSLNMDFLNKDESWKLFCDKVFVQESCPLELEEVGRTIVKNCKGLPLSIVVIGGLLAKSERRKEYWEYIARDTIAVISSEDDEQCRKILSLSYQSLPVHLKSCFLYLGAFSEDEKISASMLIKLWIAEGFLKSNCCSKELIVLGEEYLNDLISRNLFMVDRRGPNGKIKFCVIHDVLRDICLKKAQDGKFMYAQKLGRHDEVQFIGRQRRISFHKSVSNEENISHTLKSSPVARTLICTDPYKALPPQNLRLMRVLNCNNDVARYSLNDIFPQLVNSRLIKLRTISGPVPFPSSLCLLWNLQILIIGDTRERGRVIAPLEIWDMTELRHLKFIHRLYLPDPPPSRQLHTLKALEKLHTLKYIKDFVLSYEVVKRIPNIMKFHIFYDLAGKEVEKGLKYLVLLKKLESLVLSFKQQTSSDLLSNLTFPNSLKKLSLSGCGFHWEDMSIIASIPHLQVLKLLSNAFVGPEWVLGKQVFHCLKYLLIFSCKDLVHWIANDTHFPCLEHIQLESLKNLDEIPSGIGDIHTLQTIELLVSSKSAVISAKNILEEQENNGNVGLQVMVSCFKDDELESLAGDNFIVTTY